jgi:hypothetical protein
VAEMELRYGAVERALAGILGVPADQARAFRARLRHLRNIGVPELPKPGTGQPIAYTFEHALELLVALRLESIGTAPRVISLLTKSITNEYRFHANSERAREWGDLFIIVYPAYSNPKDYAWHNPTNLQWPSDSSPPFYLVSRGLELMPKFEEHAPDVYSRLNVSSCARKLSAELEKG